MVPRDVTQLRVPDLPLLSKEMSTEDAHQGPSLSFSSIKEDGTLSCGDLVGSLETRNMSRACCSLQSQTPEGDMKCLMGVAGVGQSPLLKALMEAEAAANAAAIQLVSYKHAMEDEFAVSRQSAVDKRQIRRQRGLLLEKLEDFKRINKSVRQKLKLFRETEFHRIDTNHQIDILTKKIAQAESENEHLKRDLDESKQAEDELMDLRREQQEKIKTAVHLTKAVEATRAHLQGQLRNKEAENNRLTVQLRNLQRTLIEQKAEVDDLRRSIASVTARAEEDKESFKKATRAQKRRTERFEAAVEKCYAQMREKNVQLANALSESDSWKRRTEQMKEEKDNLVAHVELLKRQIADLTARLHKEKDDITAANKSVMQRIEKLSSVNGELGINNAALKASVAVLEQQLAGTEAALIEERIISQERKHQAEQRQSQFAELQAEVGDLRIKYASLVSETDGMRNRKDSEVEKVRQELQGRVEELKVYSELLSAAEQSLFECQENLRRLEGNCSEKSESIRQLQVKIESQSKLLRSSVEMKESILEANLQLQEKVNSLKNKMNNVQQENLELVRRLAAQEEALSYSDRQLDQRPSECQTLSRQLEAALSDVRQQLNNVKDQAASREEALQTKILALEAEKSRRETELKLLRQSKMIAEKQFKVRLKDLQVSLDQSESHKQSIQNYVDFLKNSYKTMFDDGRQTSSFGSSYFLK